METLSGTVERITFFNPENGYSVVKIMPDSAVQPGTAARDGTVTVVGAMTELNAGENVRFTGQWVDDARYGRQFRAETVTPLLPTNPEGIVSYLSSGIVKGIGRRTAEKIVSHFGADTLAVLDTRPSGLYDVPGLRASLAAKLIAAWTDNQAARQAMIFLQGYGVSSRMAARIFRHYGAETITRVREDPYTLADEVFGIGFVRADAIARSMGLAPDARERLRAGLLYTLNQLASEGHTCAPRSQLIETAGELLKIDNPTRLSAVLDAQISASHLVSDSLPAGEYIYLPMYYHAERGAAQRLRALAAAPSQLMADVAKAGGPALVERAARAGEVALSEQQRAAVLAALTNKVSVLTGGPGTGKTTTLRTAIGALNALKATFMLASPTGRAAKRLSESTGCPASTIHRLLGYKPGEGFLRDENTPLETDVVVVDEASMLDLLLFYSLLKALRPQTHLLLVGDVDQLPSVGAGSVLQDVIAGGTAHVTRLQTIFRQGEDSHIVLNAHRINRGDAPFMDNQSADFFFFGEDDPAKAAELVVDIVANRLPQRFGYDPFDDVQVIAPMYRGPAGVTALNQALQAALNGSQRVAEKRLGGQLFRVGDKVMQTRNDYEKDVFNGDIGRVRAFNFDDSELQVVIDGRFITYDFAEAEALMLAYCISTHRSQGSEYPAVVIPLLTQHYMMLQRNLLYTAITRAKKTVVLVGSRRAVHLAVNNNQVAERHGGLLPRLRGNGKQP